MVARPYVDNCALRVVKIITVNVACERRFTEALLVELQIVLIVQI